MKAAILSECAENVGIYFCTSGLKTAILRSAKIFWAHELGFSLLAIGSSPLHRRTTRDYPVIEASLC